MRLRPSNYTIHLFLSLWAYTIVTLTLLPDLIKGLQINPLFQSATTLCLLIIMTWNEGIERAKIVGGVFSLLFAVTLLPTATGEENVVKEVPVNASITPYKFRAYDCARPYGVHDITFRDLDTGCASVVGSPIVSHEQVSMRIMQMEKKRHITAYRVIKTRTQRMWYCGAYDHQTESGPKESFYEQTELILAEDVWSLQRGFPHKYMEFKDNKFQWQERHIPLNGRTTIKYFGLLVR